MFVEHLLSPFLKRRHFKKYSDKVVIRSGNKPVLGDLPRFSKEMIESCLAFAYRNLYFESDDKPYTLIMMGKLPFIIVNNPN
jgi:hypothetical protein